MGDLDRSGNIDPRRAPDRDALMLLQVKDLPECRQIIDLQGIIDAVPPMDQIAGRGRGLADAFGD